MENGIHWTCHIERMKPCRISGNITNYTPKGRRFIGFPKLRGGISLFNRKTEQIKCPKSAAAASDDS
jgi:hypothetical protein